MLEFRFKNFINLLSMAKLALLEAKADAQGVRLTLAHRLSEGVWGLSLEGDYPKEGPSSLTYDMLFTIRLCDLKIADEEPQAKYLRALAGKIPNTLTDSMVALRELESTKLLTIDPKNPPSIPTGQVYTHRTVSMG
jgi:hypothetical protein